MRTTMSDHLRRVASPGSRRLLPAVLGIAVCVAALSGCSPDSPSGGRSTTVSAPATATPTVVIPTTSAIAAPRPSVVPTTVQRSTPATNPPSGTTFDGEGISGQQAADLQQAVDSGHQPWRLDRVQVAKSFVQARFGWTNVQTSTGAPTVVFVTNADGVQVALHLAQPATKGDAGIWVVADGVWS